jgi:hypothetical protein
LTSSLPGYGRGTTVKTPKEKKVSKRAIEKRILNAGKRSVEIGWNNNVASQSFRSGALRLSAAAINRLSSSGYLYSEAVHP